MANQELIAGCDLGSYKVVGLVGIKEEDKIKVLGWGESESKGIEKGVIVNIEKASEAIEEALKGAFRMAGKEKKEVMVSISGEHAEGKIEKGFVVIQSPDNEIRRDDVKKVIEQAKTRSFSEEKEVIFVYPNHFIVDDQKGIKEPVGMIGIKLEVEAFVLRAKKNILRTIEKCFKRANLQIEGYITQPIASSFAVLDEEEKTQGCVLIDIGKGTTDLAIWKDDGIQYTNTLKMGGDLLVNDLATCLRIPKVKAEELLKKYGFVHPKYAQGKETLLIERTSGRAPIKVTPEEYAQITEARLIEIFKFCEGEILKWGRKEDLIAGVVLTGGYANLEGIEEIAEEVFKLSVIKKGAQDVIGLSDEIKHPSYSAAIGTLKIGIREREKIEKMKKKSFLKKLFDFLEKI